MTDTLYSHTQGTNAENARGVGGSLLARGVEHGWATAALRPAVGDTPQDSASSTPHTGARSHSPSSLTTSNALINSVLVESTVEDGIGRCHTGITPHPRARQYGSAHCLTTPYPEPQMRTAQPHPGQIRPTEAIHNLPRNVRPAPTKRTRGTLKVATINVRGAGSKDTHYKWGNLNTIMKSENIAVLAVQETHTINDDKLEELNSIHGYRMKIFHSPMPDHPNSAGIAIIINTYTTRWKEATMQVIIPGRAILLNLPWSCNNSLIALAIYAPNSPSENEAFWHDIHQIWITKSLPKPDIFLGDFNMVEQEIDRRPMHLSRSDANESFESLTSYLKVEDTWRNTHPNTEGCTWISSSNNTRQSRIDRIYMSDAISAYAHRWDTSPTIIKSDHYMVSAKIYHPDAPFIGSGRWTLPLASLKDHSIINSITESGRKALEEVDALPAGNSNDNDNTKIQKIFCDWKDNMISDIRKILRTKIPKIDARIQTLKNEIKTLSKTTSPDSDAQNVEKGIMSKQLEELLEKRHLNTRTSMEINGWVHREIIRKFWMTENKERKPRDTFYRLQIPGSSPIKYASSTKEMGEIAREHHNSIQTLDIPENEPDRKEIITSSLHKIPRNSLENDHRLLEALITTEEIEAEIHHLPNGKSPGIDGLPHEFWKTVADRHTSKVHSNKADESFDVIRLLTLLFNNIAEKGIRKDTHFAEGWMCPLYKKKDRTNIENYRPITVLNADYKILTRVLTVRLANAAPHLIHPDQAGFMPGRRIEDHTDLIHLIIEKCEMNEENGALIFLDQEKAYDKIRHDYLWSALRKQNIPERFINIVQSLYNDAHTQILLNGTLSKPYKITRGVRQGDPLSYLLFNFAIEPLACLLRASNLNGINIKGQPERLIATLFADDTTVYLSNKDDLGHLMEILNGWCKASGAKFNIEKTIILPLGTTEYKETLRETRQLNITSAAAHENIHILSEGESTRVLGAHVGSGTNQLYIWKPIIAKIAKNLNRWSRSNPTQEGRRLIANMEVGGRTQYLARVQGMPDDVTKTLNKMVSKFVWGENQPGINEDTMRAPIRVGGRKLIDIQARNEAIELRRYQRWCEPDENERPRWAYVADEILLPNIKIYNNVKDENTVVFPPLQSFKISLASRSAPIPEQLLRTLKVKNKYRVHFDPPSLPETLKLALPIWYHIGRTNANINNNTDTRQQDHTNRPTSVCLRKIHNVRTVKDAAELAKRAQQGDHKARKNCKCSACRTDTSKGCKNPNTCIQKCTQLLSKLPNKYRPTLVEQPQEMNPINPPPNSVHFIKKTYAHSLSEAFRVFCNKNPNAEPIPHNFTPPNIDGSHNNTETITVYTDGSCINNGSMEAKAGAGIWYAHNSEKNKSLRLSANIEQSNNTGELIAILHAVETNPTNCNLHILTDSQYAIDNMTRYRSERENNGWINTANRDICRKMIASLRQRCGETFFSKVKGHSGNEGNEEADKLAQSGANKLEEDIINLEIPEEFHINGASLIGMSQAMLYRGIREHKERKLESRRNAVVNLETTRWAAKEKWDYFPTDAMIWNAIRDHGLDRKIRAFLYKYLHGTLKIGHYWDNIPNHERKGDCAQCGTVESLDHIMSECTATGQSTVWQMANHTLSQRGIDVTNLSLPDIIASPLAAFKQANGKPDAGLNRLYKIIITESMYTIWLIRCQWRFDREADTNKIHTKKEIRAKWLSRIDGRIRIDQALACRRDLTWKKTSKKVVLSTWQGTLHNESLLPEDWTWMRGVLVGAEDGRRPPGRNR